MGTGELEAFTMRKSDGGAPVYEMSDAEDACRAVVVEAAGCSRASRPGRRVSGNLYELGGSC